VEGRHFGLGFFNPSSLIAVRLLGTHNEINTEFFRDRIMTADRYRKTIFPGEHTYRAVFGESDFLPGLVVDRFDHYLAIQILSAGMELLKNEIIHALLEVYPDTKGIVEKNMSYLRKLEGLTQEEGVIFGSVADSFQVEENKIKLDISLLDSQKTGYFLDQRENRHFIRNIASGKKVLDCYCNQGGFALNAIAGGADEVVAVDISEKAISQARLNAELNKMKGITFVVKDCVDYLNDCAEHDKKFDIVILDPPAFAKNKKSVPTASAAYKKINKAAMKIIHPSGFLVTSSCSQHVSEADFVSIVDDAARSAGRKLRVVFRGLQSPDHPILLSMPETRYLKFFVFQVF
jgi:23S rRNA (cytosine1962-C5)-methyltransferase